MTALINKEFPVGFDGFVILKAVMGSDRWIDQCARHAPNTVDRTDAQVKRLITHMMKNHHTSPFEFAELVFHLRVPMDTWRQMIRHRTASVNEKSTRYEEATGVFHRIRPDAWRLQSERSRQGSSGEQLDLFTGEHLTKRQLELQSLAQDVYRERLEAGVARELARMDLPLSTYTEAFWKIDLHNLLHFLHLRCAPEAQQEIREYAWIIRGIVQELFPITFAAWETYVESS